MAVQRVEIRRKGNSGIGTLQLSSGSSLFYEELTCYLVESSCGDIKELLEKSKFELFGSSITDEITIGSDNSIELNSGIGVEIGYLFGVTDNSAKVVEEGLTLLYPEISFRAKSFKTYLFKSSTAHKIQTYIHRYFGNKLINQILFLSSEQFNKRFENIPTTLESSLENSNDSAQVIEMSLELSDKELVSLSSERCLALTLEELHAIRDFFRQVKIREERVASGLPLNPTDVELEIIAQTWSEHCKHKIFSADIDYKESCSSSKKIGNLKVNSLFKEYIKGATSRVNKAKENDFTISLFHDNAGIVRFDNNVDIAVKVETHNGPSGLDPYGGALTGILGVNRDIIGTGIGAKPIANCDVFCVGELDIEETELPKELIHPREILKGIHKGVMDGGNKSGIPTVNGAMLFDRDYSGKPLVYCGTVGVIPQKTKEGVEGSSKHVTPGMRVVMVGGAIGADGIHGATFSSLEFNEHSPSSAVQIGDPFTQKKMLDFIIEARDLALYSTLTDNGAGGLSSSVGEMANYTGGASIDLSLCPVKYSGLTPYQLVISESQERMTVAVPVDTLGEFLELASRRDLLATDIGEFNSSGFFELKYRSELVGRLPLEFLHEGTPTLKLEASWDGPIERESWCKELKKKNLDDNYEEALLEILSDTNVASKENIVRMYDHEVQGATVVRPFGGVNGEGPNSSGVIWMYPHGGEYDSAITLSSGIAPKISLTDCYLMAKYSVDEAIRNSIAVGGDPDNLAILDNFCWPDPVSSPENEEGSYRAAQLVRCCVGLYEASVSYGAPLISGKDSMKNNFRSSNGTKIGVLPTLLVTAVSKANTNHIVESSFTAVGDQIYLLSSGALPFINEAIFGKYYNSLDVRVEDFDTSSALKLYRELHNGIKRSIFSSVQDISDGGLITAVVESAIGGDLGADVTIKDISNLPLFLFGERAASFIITVPVNKAVEFNRVFKSSSTYLGVTTKNKSVRLTSKSRTIIDLSLESLKSRWKREEWW